MTDEQRKSKIESFKSKLQQLMHKYKPAWAKELDKIDQAPQRQDSLSSQLKELKTIAVKFGMYDASKFIDDLLNFEAA